MKKYVKPDVYYENFEMSQHVATCAWDMSNSKDEYSCSATSDGGDGNDPGITVFNNNKNCSISDPEVYCYTNGSSSLNVFNS